MKTGLTMGIFLLAAAAVAVEPLAPPVFGPRPRLAYTAAELATWKADAARSNEVAAAVARAEAALKADLTVPEKEGQWIFYYACPKDSTRLNPQSDEKHVCPTCKAVYTDPRTVAAYRTLRNNEIDQRCQDLGVAFALTGDEKYARPVRAVLLKLAQLYPTWKHHDRWGHTGILAVVGGWRYCQLLDESASLIALSSAYDLVAQASCFTEADCKTVEDGLLKTVARQIMKFQLFIERENNHQTWFNAAYAAVGLVTGDGDLLKAAVYGKRRGLLWQLDHSVTDDGLWYEGANAYHFYALMAIQKTLDSAKRAGWVFPDNTRLKSLWTGPLQMTYPDGSMPVINDSDPAHIRNYPAFYKWAFDYFKDPLFACYAGLPAKDGSEVPALKSVAMKGSGIAVLRRGEGADAVCAMMDYGIHGGHHGHPDKLNIVVFAMGKEWALDPGRISYSVPEYNEWCRTTLAHNTVEVKGRSQEATTGELWHFEDTNTYAAALCATAGAYPGYVMKRFLVLTDEVLVDIMSVEGKKRVPMDWILHVRGEMALESNSPLMQGAGPMTFQAQDKPLGKGNGYPYLKSVQQLSLTDFRVLAFTQPTAGLLRVILPGDRESEVFLGKGTGYRVDDAVPFVLRRRLGSAACFVAVYDLTGKGLVSGVELVSVETAKGPLAAWEGQGVRIAMGKESLLVGVDLRQKPGEGTSVAGNPFVRLLVRREQ